MVRYENVVCRKVVPVNCVIVNVSVHIILHVYNVVGLLVDLYFPGGLFSTETIPKTWSASKLASCQLCCCEEGVE